jgi:hypothetical protein
MSDKVWNATRPSPAPGDANPPTIKRVIILEKEKATRREKKE